MNKFNTLEITIQRKLDKLDDNYPVVAKYSQSLQTVESQKKGKFFLTEEAVSELKKLQRQPKKYGEYLGKMLFQGDINLLFFNAYKDDNNLEILLFIEAEDKKLKDLLWERLCAYMDGEWRLLRRDQRAFYSLHIPSGADRPFPPIVRKDLRALVLVASPEDSQGYHLNTFDVENTVDSIRKSLGKTIPCDFLAHGIHEASGLPTLENFKQQLQKQSYTFLHFVCHGRHDNGNNDIYLYWTDENNKCKPFHGKELIEELKNFHGPNGLPHFVFLCTCESAAPSEEGAFGGFAGELVRDLGILAVVGMTEKITIKTAEKMVESFYKQLTKHGWVARALHEATSTVSDRDDVLVPVLFSRLKGELLFSDEILSPSPDPNPISEQERLYLDKLHTDAESMIKTNKNILEYTNGNPTLVIKLLELPYAVKQLSGIDYSKYKPEALYIKDIGNIFQERNVGQKLLLLGDAGSGKTTAIITIMEKFNRKDYSLPFPVFLSLSSWKDSQYRNFDDWLVQWLSQENKIPNNIAIDLINKQKLMLFLDGLDEIDNENSRIDCINKLNKFIGEKGLTEIIICSRLKEYQELLNSKYRCNLFNKEMRNDISYCSENLKLDIQKAFYLMPLESKEMILYIKKIKRISESEHYLEYLQKLISRYKSLRNPLVVYLITKINKDFEKELQQKKGNALILKVLFDKYVEEMLDNRKDLAKFSDYYGKGKNKNTKQWLQYLANKLKNQEKFFQIEKIQPSWLDSEKDKYLYFTYHIATGLTIGLILGITAGLYFVYITPSSIPMTATLGLKLIFIGLLSGLITGGLRGIAPCFINNELSVNMKFTLETERPDCRELSFLQKCKFNIQLFLTIFIRRLIRGAIPGIMFILFIILIFNLVEPIYFNNYSSAIFLSCIFSTMSFSLMRNNIKIPLFGQIRLAKVVTTSLIFTIIGILYTVCRTLLFPQFYEGKGWYTIYEIIIFSIVGAIYGGTIIQQQYKPSDKPEKFDNGIIYLRNYAILSFASLTISGMLVGWFFDSVRSPVLICLGLAVGLLGALNANEGAAIICIQHFILRIILYLKGYIPWNYAMFLNYATEKVFLIKNGRSYSFLNNKLLDYFVGIEQESDK